MHTITIKLPKTAEDRLQRLAVRYGFSVTELSRHVLEELVQAVPEETFVDYRNPRALRASVRRGFHDYAKGRIRTRL